MNKSDTLLNRKYLAIGHTPLLFPFSLKQQKFVQYVYCCRYWAVTNIDYVHQRTGRRIGLMISIVWIFSFSVSIAPMLGWKDPEWNKRLDDLECLVSQDVYYQIFATASSFYVPLLVILVLYWRIFQTARKRIRRRQQVIIETITHIYIYFLSVLYCCQNSFLQNSNNKIKIKMLYQ